MDKSRWDKEYPKMPEAFHLAIEESVRRNLEGEPEIEPGNQPQGKGYRKPTRRRILVLSLAAVMLFGALTAIAKEKEEKFDLGKYLEVRDYDTMNSIFQKDISVKVEEEVTLLEGIDMEWVKTWEKREDNSPLLDIQQLMYDGAQLCIYAVPTENGKDYEIGSNHLFVDGERVGPIDQWDNYGKCDFYIYTVDMRALALKAPFKVTLPLSVYGKGGRYENQDLSFTVDTEAVVESIKDQEFIFEDYTVKVTGMKKSATTFWGKVKVERTKEQQAAYEEGDREITFLLFKSKDGTAWRGQPLTEKEGVESGPKTSQWYFSKKIPSGNVDSVMLYLLAQEKDKIGEKFDIYNVDSSYGEGMEIILK